MSQSQEQQPLKVADLGTFTMVENLFNLQIKLVRRKQRYTPSEQLPVLVVVDIMVEVIILPG